MEITHHIRRCLKRLSLRRLPALRGGEAAVLVAIVLRGDEPCFLLTRRTETVSTHKGQISFPGGVREAADSNLVETALRETEEEIGIAATTVEILGEFHDFRAVTDQVVRSVVGRLPSDADFRLHHGEVAYLLEVPFDFFRTHPPQVRQRQVDGESIEVYYFDFRGEIIWGLTARIIKEFLDALAGE